MSIFFLSKEDFCNQKPQGGIELGTKSFPLYSFVEADVNNLRGINGKDKIDVKDSFKVKGLICAKVLEGPKVAIILYHNNHEAPGALKINSFHYRWMNVLFATKELDFSYDNNLHTYIDPIESVYTSIEFNLEYYLEKYPFTFGLSGSLAKMLYHKTNSFLDIYTLDYPDPRDIDLVVHPDEKGLIEEFRELERRSKELTKKQPKSGKPSEPDELHDNMISFRAGRINYDVFISDDLKNKMHNGELVRVQNIDRIHAAMKEYDREKDKLYFKWLQTEEEKDFADFQIKWT